MRGPPDQTICLCTTAVGLYEKNLKIAQPSLRVCQNQGMSINIILPSQKSINKRVISQAFIKMREVKY